MKKNKTRQSIAKRFKITKNGKIIHRCCGQDHFNARESGNKTRKKRQDRNLSKSNQKIIKYSLNQ